MTIDGGEREARATGLARRRIAYVLTGLVTFLIAADVVLPDDEFRIDEITLVVIVVAILLLLGITVKSKIISGDTPQRPAASPPPKDPQSAKAEVRGEAQRTPIDPRA